VRTRVAFLLVVTLVLPARAFAVAIATSPEPVLFQRHMRFTDRVETPDRTVVRLVLGGRVMVLARGGAALRITEVPGATTIDVERGRVAVTVDRENLQAEDLVEVRTPHAVVTVPDETVVVEVAEGASTFTSLGPRLEVFGVEPATGGVVEPPLLVAADEAVVVGPPVTIRASR
jgi:hypothetical protein